LAVALIFGIVFTENSHYTHDKLKVAQKRARFDSKDICF
jgi:hypothetical protein